MKKCLIDEKFLIKLLELGFLYEPRKGFFYSLDKGDEGIKIEVVE